MRCAFYGPLGIGRHAFHVWHVWHVWRVFANKALMRRVLRVMAHDRAFNHAGTRMHWRNAATTSSCTELLTSTSAAVMLHDSHAHAQDMFSICRSSRLESSLLLPISLRLILRRGSAHIPLVQLFSQHQPFVLHRVEDKNRVVPHE